MADAGTIGFLPQQTAVSPLAVWAAGDIQTYPVLARQTVQTAVRVFAPWALTGDRTLLQIPTNGTISGTLTDEGSPAPYRTVRLYHRQTGDLICSTKSNANGGYTFYNLEPGAAYMVVGVYDRLATQGRNAIVFDEVVAV